MPREIQLQVESLLKQHGTTKTDLAKRLKISEGTFRAYVDNKWTVLDRTVMERMLDIFQCDVGSLLNVSENPFFDPFQSDGTSRCLYLLRPNPDEMNSEGRAVGLFDNRAINHLGELLEDMVPGIVPQQGVATNPKEFSESLSKNCVAIGSPIVNPASEMAICRVFGVKPFDPSQSRNLPFTFKVTRDFPERPSSILERSLDGKEGIWLRSKGKLVEADALPKDEFRKRGIRRGRDCAVVIVSNHAEPNGSGRPRKLIVLSGSRGVGTEGAALALAEQYRDFEPRGKEPVWGILEVIYSKPSHTETQTIRGSYWRYRSGGRCPVEFTKRRS
jgi:hypothetical protein